MHSEKMFNVFLENAQHILGGPGRLSGSVSSPSSLTRTDAGLRRALRAMDFPTTNTMHCVTRFLKLCNTCCYTALSPGLSGMRSSPGLACLRLCPSTATPSRVGGPPPRLRRLRLCVKGLLPLCSSLHGPSGGIVMRASSTTPSLRPLSYCSPSKMKCALGPRPEHGEWLLYCLVSCCCRG